MVCSARLRSVMSRCTPTNWVGSLPPPMFCKVTPTYTVVTPWSVSAASTGWDMPGNAGSLLAATNAPPVSAAPNGRNSPTGPASCAPLAPLNERTVVGAPAPVATTMSAWVSSSR